MEQTSKSDDQHRRRIRQRTERSLTTEEPTVARASIASHQQRTEEDNCDTWCLQSPLNLQLQSQDGGNADSSHPTLLDSDLVQEHDARVRPLLSILCVAASVLELSVEARFCAASLLHRYHYYSCYANSDKPNKSSGAKAPDDKKKSKTGKDTMDSNDNDTSKIPHDAWIVAACLFLACKVQETPRRMRDVINCVHMITTNDTEEVSSSSSHSHRVKLQWQSLDALPDLNQFSYWNDKERIILLEQEVLQWLRFDCIVPSPHRMAVVLFMDEKQPSESDNDTSSSTSLRQLLVMEAWKRLNDSIFSIKALQHHSVLCLAMAAIGLAVQDIQNNRISTNGDKCDNLALTNVETDLDHIRISTGQSTEQVEAARRTLEGLSSRGAHKDDS